MFFVSLAPSFEHTPLALGGSKSSVVGTSRSGQYSAELQAQENGTLISRKQFWTSLYLGTSW